MQVLPRRVAGTVIKYRVQVSAEGELRLLEPRRDTHTLAHDMLGEEQWLFVQFDDVEQATRSSSKYQIPNTEHIAYRQSLSTVFIVQVRATHKYEP